MNFFQNLLKTVVLFTLVLLFAVSCKDDDSYDLNEEGDNENYISNFLEGDDDDEFDSLCFQFVYPITVLLPDGSNQSANSDDDLFTIVDNWYANNPDDDDEEEPTLNFPVDVTLEDGTTQAVNNEEELEELFEDCFGKWDDDDYGHDDDDDEYDDDEWDDEFEICFDFIYPITVLLPDSTSQVVNNDEELDNIILTWFEDNPNSEDFPTLEFPIQVEMDSTILDINSEEELEELFEECEDWDYEGNPFEECFIISYPVTIEFPNGTTTAVNSNEELEAAIEDWYVQNPDTEEDPTLAYPIEVTLVEDGSVVTINSDEEFEEIIEDCFECLVINPNVLTTGAPNTTVAAMAIKRQRIN